VTREDVPRELIESERSIYTKQAEQEGKPEKVIAKIVEGKVNKFVSQICLVDQPFVKDPDRTVAEVLAGTKVTAFHRFKLGEAIDS
jgi:elongation factor Ts